MNKMDLRQDVVGLLSRQTLDKIIVLFAGLADNDI